MRKRKKKLVCVGWGIWDIDSKCFWRNRHWTIRKDAIKHWEFWFEEKSYQRCRKHGEIIAKKLWVESE